MKKVSKRFIDIWKLDFLAKFLSHGKSDNKTTIWFWIISNLVLVLILLISFSLFLIGAPNEIVTAIEKNVPDGARITIIDGQLTTENIDEPFFREISASNKGTNYDEKIAIIVDTQGQTYDIASLDEYKEGFLILGDRAYTKDDTKINQLVFKDIPNISFAKEDVISWVHKYFLFFAISLGILMGSILFFYFVVLRLVSAFWWALMLFIFMRIFDVRESYIIAYKAVLNFYFIPSIAVLVLGLIGFGIPFITTIIFMAIFIANLIWLKRQYEDTSVKEALNIPEKEAENTSVIQIKK